jgi:hypothetical protein
VQTVKNANTLDTKGTKALALIGPTDMLKSPKASAYAVNIDPVAVDWMSPGSRTITLDLTGIELQAKTTGLGSSAAATDVFTVAVRDGVTDVTLPEDDALQLFKLSLGVYSANGSPASALVDLSFLGFTPATDPGGLFIADNEGGSGLAAVWANLVASFMPMDDGIYRFVNILRPADLLTITLTVPGSAASSVLYFDEYQGAGAHAVPEASTVALLIAGLLALGMMRSAQVHSPICNSVPRSRAWRIAHANSPAPSARYARSSAAAIQKWFQRNTPSSSTARIPSKTCAEGIAQATACSHGGST